MFGKGLQVAAIASLTMLASCGSPPPVSIDSPAPVLVAVTVTLYDCGQPYPCEQVTNQSTRPLTLTMRNTYQRQTIEIAPGETVEFRLDATDNRPGSPLPEPTPTP